MLTNPLQRARSHAQMTGSGSVAAEFNPQHHSIRQREKSGLTPSWKNPDRASWQGSVGKFRDVLRLFQGVFVHFMAKGARRPIGFLAKPHDGAERLMSGQAPPWIERK